MMMILHRLENSRDWRRQEAKERPSRCCERNISASERLMEVATTAEVKRLDWREAAADPQIEQIGN